jgi:pSer/pThr/pTyr-binding forkhead associated (FHA) protein
MTLNQDTDQVRYYLEDLDSSNGTKVNGIELRKGEKVALKHSDVITVGKAMKIEFKAL